MKSVFLAVALAVALVTAVDAQSLRQDESLSALRQAPAAASDPMKILYRVSGLKDSGGAANEGLASVIVCTSFSQTPENIRVGVYGHTGTVLTNSTYGISARQTGAFSTRANTSYTGNVLSVSPFPFGFAVVSASTTNLHCSASIINAGVLGQGYGLHMTRFNPHPGSVE